MTRDCPKKILIVDDNKNIHWDFYKVLNNEIDDASIAEVEALLLDKTAKKSPIRAQKNYEIDSAFQGKEAVELVRKAVSNDQPYALAFVSLHLPPGWDGIKTIKKIWKLDPNIQIVICVGPPDQPWNEIAEELGESDNLLVLKKPFESTEILQLASALTKKWDLVANVQLLVQDRTVELENLLLQSKATLESTQEGIIVVSQNGKVMAYNNKFIEIFNLNSDLLDSGNSNLIFHNLANQVEEPLLFNNIMVNLISSPKTGIIREWEMKNGTILELYVHPQAVNKQVVGAVFSFRDVTERKCLEGELLHQATHDSLTGLSNRLLLTDRIQQAIVHAKRRKSLVGVLVFDLDNFKQINDSLGHNAGDTLLKIVSKKLVGSVRESDTVTRLGGDEFVVVLASQEREEDILLKVNDLLKLFIEPIKLNNKDLIVTTSIGVSIYPKDGQDPDTLLKNADVALYRAKEMGRNTYKTYIAEFNAQLLEQAEMTTALRQALQKNEFILHYQPLVVLNTNKIVGLEALVRWNHPKLGLIAPSVFIPLAEESGLIVTIGEWILKTACMQNKIWQKQIDSDLRMAVNISGHQFEQANFVEVVSNILKETGLNPKSLELEITESVLLATGTDVSQKMSELKKLGIHFSLDDFGTGYASLSYLKYFPFDKLKIDKSFIDGIPNNTEDRTIVEAIINMTKTMGMEVLAEGVEKVEQIDFLRKHHSNQVQGFYFSPPMDAQCCTEMLKQPIFKGL